MSQEEIVIAVWMFGVLISTGAGIVRGRPFAGFIWGLLLGPLGLIIVLWVLPNPRRKRKLKESERQALQLWKQSKTRV